MNLFNLIAKITLDDKDYQKGISSATTQGKTFGQSVASAAKIGAKALAAMYTAAVTVATALSKITLEAVSYGDEIDKESQKLNMSTTAYQKWKILLEQAGTSIDTMSTGMRTFTDILDAASEGDADALLSLQKLGLGYEDFDGLSVEDSLLKVVEAFQSMEDGADKTQLAIDLFGRSGQELLPLLNSEVGSIEDLWASYEDLGLIISDDVVDSSADLSDMITLLKTKFTTLGTAIGAVFYPALKEIISGLTGLANGEEEAFDELQSGITDMLSTAISYLPKIADFAAQVIPAIVNMIVETLPELLDAAFQIIDTLAAFLIDYLPELIPVAINIVLTLIQGILDDLPSLVDTAISLVLAIAEGLINALPAIVEAAPKIIIALVNGIVDAIPKLIDAAIQIILMLTDYLTTPENIVTLVLAAVEIISAIAAGLIDAIPQLIAAVPQIITALVDSFKAKDWKSIGLNIVYGIRDGIVNAASAAIEAAKNAAQSIYDSVKGFFGIASPSKLMRDEVGKYIPQGIAVGVEEEMPAAAESIKNSVKKNTSTADIVNGINSVMKINAANGNSNMNVAVYIGNEELKSYAYKAVDDKQKQRGLKSLAKVGGYSGA